MIWAERYNRNIRRAWLGPYSFETIEEVQQIATGWPRAFNNDRPNMGIGGITHARNN